MAAITLRPTGDSRNEKVGLDWWLLGSAALLIIIGLAAIMSSTAGESGTFFKKQILNICLGLVPASIFGFCHPRIWAKMVNYIYVANVIALIAVLAIGDSAKGAERWIELGPIRLQPSEFSKILIVLTLATFYSMRQDRIKEPSTFLLGLLHVAAPMLLILKQPHLGATLLVGSVWLAMSLVAGVRPAYILAIVLPFFIMVGLVVKVPSIGPKVFEQYQWKRIEALLGLRSDTKEAKDMNYQTQQAIYAFGNGGLGGTGFSKGEQKSKVPEQHTDFIFSLIGEEFGFVGSVFVLGVFAVFFYRIWVGMLNAADFYYQMIMGGILTIFAFHLFVNIGMVLKLLPVVGLWCPFLSYGGTAIWLCMSLVGLALNVRAKERAVLF